MLRGQEGRAGLLVVAFTVGGGGGDSGRVELVGSSVAVAPGGIDDSALGSWRKSPPACVSAPPPLPQTSNMSYCVDLWRWPGSTFN